MKYTRKCQKYIDNVLVFISFETRFLVAPYHDVLWTMLTIEPQDSLATKIFRMCSCPDFLIVSYNPCTRSTMLSCPIQHAIYSHVDYIKTFSLWPNVSSSQPEGWDTH